MRQRLSGWDSIERAKVNPLTASVLIEFSNLAALFAENALKNDLFEIDYDALEAAAEPAPAMTEQAAHVIAQADATVRRWTSGGADLRSLVFLLLLIGGLRQLFRGNVASPAASLLWKAGDLLGPMLRPPELQYPRSVELPPYLKDYSDTLQRHPAAQHDAVADEILGREIRQARAIFLEEVEAKRARALGD